LYEQVCDERNLDSPYSYTVVCDAMHQIAFRATVPHDDNRVADGLGLRNEFIFTERYIPSPRDLNTLMGPEASIFEVLVALSKRVNYNVVLSERTWFNIFITNLGLADYNDWRFRTQHAWRIRRILERFNDRTYREDGRGGLFPLKPYDRDADGDQRQVEIWYQWSAYATQQVLY
jgi:hypothetical protein